EAPVERPVGRRGVGMPISVRVEGDRRPLFVGVVTAVEHAWQPDRGRTVRVRAFDALHALRRQQTSGTTPRSGFGSALRDAAAALALPVCLHGEGPSHVDLVRAREDDLTRLWRLADRAGQGFGIIDGTLYGYAIDGFDPPIELSLSETLYALKATANASQVHARITAQGWHAAGATTELGKASGAPEPWLDDAPFALRNQAIGSADELTALAEAEGAHRRANAVTLEGTAAGNLNLMPGRCIQLRGLDAEFDGTYALTAVTHVIDGESGYRTEFSTARPPRPRSQKATELTPGLVTDVADPDGQGRVRVRLPTFADAETGWLPVVAPGAGPRKGLVTTPDIGDRVLVVFDEGQPGRGLVLGGLFDVGALPDAGIADGRTRRTGFFSGTGHRLVSDDQQARLRLAHASDDALMFDREGAHLHTAGTLVLEGDRIVIRANQVDFERL
ncbi:MAG: hypothetical protein KC620_19605, partial [Myxococcales bacterium]|nr:hypothetical protein [Myxococcales bacterium]